MNSKGTVTGAHGRTAAGAITAQEGKRARKYTAKQRKFLKAFVENEFKDPVKCALEAGYSPNKCYSVASELKDDIMDIAKDMLLSHAPVAASSLAGLLVADKPVPNAQTKLAAAKEVLDRVGIVKPEKVEHEHTVQGGLFILPMKAQTFIEAEVMEEEYE